MPLPALVVPSFGCTAGGYPDRVCTKAQMTPKSKRKGPTTSPERALTHAQVQLLRSKDPRLTLSGLRSRIPAGSYFPLIEWAHSLKFFEGRVFAPAYPQSTDKLWDRALLAQTSTERELLWASAYLRMYSDGLASYLRLASSFESSLVTGAYAECAAILDEMERDFGLSLWLIKNRISLLQSTEGLDSQKRYALKTKRDSIENGVVSFLTHFFSYRMEPSVSAGYFARQFENVLSNLRIPEGFKSFARYHVLPASMHSTEALGAILRYASGASAVDYLRPSSRSAEWYSQPMAADPSPHCHQLSGILPRPYQMRGSLVYGTWLVAIARLRSGVILAASQPSMLCLKGITLVPSHLRQRSC